MNKRRGILCLSPLFIFIILRFYCFDSPKQTLKVSSKYDSSTASYQNQILDKGKQKYTCQGLEFDEEIDELLATHKQVFITMPAKAAGSSMKKFTKMCMKNVEYYDNILNHPNEVENLLTDTFAPPAVIASHSYTDGVLKTLAKHATKDSLIVYIHREETDRLLSSIRYVVAKRICPEINGYSLPSGQVNNTCVIEEKKLISSIQRRRAEIGFGATSILTCGAFDAIEDNAPRMLVVDYKHANKLQRLLAKHHCPDLLEKPMHSKNAIHESKGLAFVELTNHSTTLPSFVHAYPGGIVSLEDWMKAKRNMLELSLNLKRKVTCQSDVRKMENELYACQDPAILFP